ncbi:GNAT family N-acetyltransferase, partial [Curtobacterium sp. CT11-45]|uniref:GNAT family N-acetyltransferase n=1 Tax=Curtobacterium sp. CT11-45 TaxID=3243037 RepID=UPI0039AFAAFA
VVGCVGVTAIEHTHGTAWISYWLTPEARGRGMATRALAAAAEDAFALGLHRLELGHRTNNPASCAVATRAGFRAEGVERDKLRYGDDRFDVETHARLATDPTPDTVPLPRDPARPSATSATSATIAQYRACPSNRYVAPMKASAAATSSNRTPPNWRASSGSADAASSTGASDGRHGRTEAGTVTRPGTGSSTATTRPGRRSAARARAAPSPGRGP